MSAQCAASAVDDNGHVYYDSAEDAEAYYSAKLTFTTIFPSKFGVRITNVRIIFKFLWYMYMRIET